MLSRRYASSWILAVDFLCFEKKGVPEAFFNLAFSFPLFFLRFQSSCSLRGRFLVGERLLILLLARSSTDDFRDDEGVDPYDHSHP